MAGETITNIRLKCLTVLEARIWILACLAPNQDAIRDIPLSRGLGRSPFLAFHSLGSCGHSLARGHIILICLHKSTAIFLLVFLLEVLAVALEVHTDDLQILNDISNDPFSK